MITFRSIKTALTKLLKSKYPDYKVHFDNVEKSDAPYFYVEMRPSAATVDGDGVYCDKNIEIDITFVPDEDKYGRVARMVLFDVAEALDHSIRPVFRIEDRAITIPRAEMTVHDDILHYIFQLLFTDADMDAAEYELMEELTLNINKED